MVVAEIPRFAADVFGCGTEDGALDGHASMRRIVVPRGQEALDGEPEQDDASVLAVEVPPGHLLCRVESRDRTDLEPHVLEFGPRATEEFDRGADGEVEPVDAPVERSQGRPDDLASAQPTVTTVPGTPPSSGGG